MPNTAQTKLQSPASDDPNAPAWQPLELDTPDTQSMHARALQRRLAQQIAGSRNEQRYERYSGKVRLGILIGAPALLWAGLYLAASALLF